MRIRRRYKYLATGYLAGALAVELLQFWIGTVEFPYREIGALFWPILVVVSFLPK
jgi:hypothetical protein